MFRSIVLSVALLFSAGVLAQETTPNPCADLANSTKGLSPDKVSVILESCRDSTKAAPAIVEKMADPDVADKWSNAAMGIARAIGIAAKELGIAANDFLDSPAGFLVAALLLFNYAGGFIVGLPVTILTVLIASHLLRRVWTDKVEYETVNYLWGLLPIRRIKTRTNSDLDCGGVWAMTATVLAAAGVLNLIVWLNVT